MLVIWQGEIANGARDDETQKKDKDIHSAYTMCVFVTLQNEKYPDKRSAKKDPFSHSSSFDLSFSLFAL